MNFLEKAWNNLLSIFDLDEDVLHVPDAHTYPTEPLHGVSPHVISHSPNVAYANDIPASFEEDYVEPKVRKKPGPKPKFATDEERKAARKAYMTAYHNRRYAGPLYRDKRVNEMRQRRGKTAETVQGYSKRNLGISAKDDRSAYQRAYYEQVKKTGNTPKTFSN